MPLQIADPNVISVPYTTNVLFPKIGPLAVKRYVRIVARLPTDYATMIKAAELDKKERKWKRKGRAAGQPFLRNPAFVDPRAKGTPSYENFIAEFRAFDRHYLYNEGAAKPPWIGTAAVSGQGGEGPALTLRDTAGLGLSIRRGVETGVLAEPLFTSRGLVVSHHRRDSASIGTATATVTVDVAGPGPAGATAKADLAGDGRLVEADVSAAQLMLPGGEVLEPLVLSADGGSITETQLIARRREQQESYETALLYSWMSRPNAVAADLFATGALAEKETVFSDEVRRAGDATEALAAALDRAALGRIKTLADRHRDYDDTRLLKLRGVIDEAFDLCERLDVDLYTLPNRYSEDERFRLRLRRYVISRIDTAGPVADTLMPLPQESTVSESREWAFQRRERLDIAVGRPTLRGPIAAEGVTPNSDLTVSESDVIERIEGFQTAQAQSQQTVTRDAGLTVNGFQTALSSMTEAGVISDQDLDTDRAMLASLRERRRERISEVIDSVSRSNETRRFGSIRNLRSRTREYVTRGKDDVFSTTEVVFQVAATAQVSVILEDIDLVWCPRVEVPFIYLHQLVIDERDRAEERYRQQNQTIDPTRPPLRYETAVHEFELPIKGNKKSRRQDFFERLPSNISGFDDAGGTWEIDRAASTIRFRNGHGDDYNWDEVGNYDDLEVHNSTWIDGPYLTGDGNVRGAVLLETTDPEYFNKGFMVYSIVMRRLDATTVAALQDWERDKESVVAERQAVAVRAKQYGELKMRELITRFEDSLEQRKEVFAALMKLVYAGQAEQHRSFYAEAVASTIDWSRASMSYEQPDLSGLPFPDYPPTHFMNVEHVRMVLPINRSAESAFFESLSAAGSYHSAAAQDARDFVDRYRTRLEELRPEGGDRLDRYSRSIILGRHIEAVLSNHPFSE